MKRLLDKQWYPQFELDFVKGIGKALFSNVERAVTFNVNSAYVFQFEPSDIKEPQFALTYESRTGISHEEKAISARWKTSCVANRRAYIGNVQVFYVDGDKLGEKNSSLINIMIGMYVATQVKIIDYWFREKKDAEHDEDMNGRKRAN